MILGFIAGSVLVSRYFNYPSVLLSAFLKFFLAYSFLIVVAAFFSYIVINVNSASWIKTLFASLIFIGMSFLMITLPGYTFKETGQEIPCWFKKSIWISGAITSLQAPVLWFTSHSLGVILPLILAFIPFIFVIFNTVRYKEKSLKNNKKPKTDKKIKSLYFYILFGLIGAAETYFGMYYDYNGNFIIISLPLAYSLSAIQIISEYSIGTQGAEQTINEVIITKFNLTVREVEIAEKILAGSSNKEIAFDLNLSQNTVRNHIYNLYQKLGIQKRMDLLNLTKHS